MQQKHQICKKDHNSMVFVVGPTFPRKHNEVNEDAFR